MTDRWHQLLGAIQDSNMSAADTSVFRFLLDKADYKTADMPAKFTPTRPAIARKTRVSLRQVHYSVGHLQRHGWLTVKHGHKAQYTLAAGTACNCLGRVHRRDKDVADVADQPSPRRPAKVANVAAVAAAAMAADPANPSGDAGLVQPEPVNGATVAPILVQRLGATPQVTPLVVLRGNEREGEEETAVTNGRQSRPSVMLKTGGGWPAGSIGEAANQ